MSAYRAEFLDAALACGAVLTGKPDGSEAITVVFTIEAWRAFDLAQQAAPVALTDAQIDVIATPYAALGGIENYRAFARAAMAAQQESKS